MSDRVLTERGIWAGGDFELSLEFESQSDVRLASALSELWENADLEGCYLDSGREPADQERVRSESIEAAWSYLGVARLPNGKKVACSSLILRGDESDSLVPGIPMCSLAIVYRVGAYPFGKQGERAGLWLRVVETWLAEIGRHVALSARFDLGVIGHEVAGHEHVRDVAARGIPADRHIGYSWPDGDMLVHHRITH